MLNTIVVDDERPSREALSTYLRDYCSDVQVVSECDSVKSAYRAIIDHKPELVFLDIEMPNGNGFDLLKLFNPIDFKIIFVTAFSEYAIKAFRFSAADYLLKPVKVDELIDAVKKVNQELATTESYTNINILRKNLAINDFQYDTLVIPDCKGFKVLNVNDIIYCEADGYCTHFHLTQKQKVTSTKNLKYYEEMLSDHNFIRVHHSSLINLKHVKAYSHQGEITLTDSLYCPLGNSYKKGFMEVFNNHR